MKLNAKIASMAMAVAMPVLFGAPAYSAYTLNVKSTGLPSDVTVANENDCPVDPSAYKRGWTLNGWVADQYSDRGYVALAPSYNRKDIPCKSSLTTPLIEIAAGDILRWEAHAVFPSRPESYQVYAVPEAGDEELLFEQANLKEGWSYNAISLQKYAGKKVAVKFLCTSVNGYSLALDKVSVDTPSEVEVIVDKPVKHYYGKADMAEGGKVTLPVGMVNMGVALSEGKIQLRVNGVTVSDLDLLALPAFKAGDHNTYNFEVPASVNEVTNYEIWYADAAGNSKFLYEDSFYTANFVRNLFVDKATGMWCNNCPAGIVVMERLAEKYGNNFIYVDTHTQDYLYNLNYFKHLGWSSIPSMMLNRIIKSTSSSDVNFKTYLNQPTDFEIQFTGIESIENGLRPTVAVKVAEDFDNSADRYRVAFILTQDIYQPGDNEHYYQENTSSKPAAMQYYFLPSKISSYLAEFHNVSLTEATAFDGIANSLPASLVPDKKYAVTYDFTADMLTIINKEPVDFSKVRVVALLLDKNTGEVLNSAAAHIGDEMAGVEGIVADEMSDNAGLSLRDGYYNLQGEKIETPVKGQLYIEIRNNVASKRIK